LQTSLRRLLSPDLQVNGEAKDPEPETEERDDSHHVLSSHVAGRLAGPALDHMRNITEKISEYKP
jgi:hypothetical protein